MSDSGRQDSWRVNPEFAGQHGQPDPIPTSGGSMHDLVIEEVLKRKQIGLERYRTLLQAGNGRDALQDLLEELIDGSVYLMQLKTERENGIDHRTAQMNLKLTEENNAVWSDNEDLRDVIRMLIGMGPTHSRLWHSVPQSEVDAYLETIRRLKGNQK